MGSFCKKSFLAWLTFFLTSLFVFVPVSQSQVNWYKAYRAGIQAMEQQNWQGAVRHFMRALEQKSKDKKKIRAYGAVFIEYYPNREIGICFYHLGDMNRAREFLRRSMQQEPSKRARTFLLAANKNALPAKERSRPPIFKPDLPRRQHVDEMPAKSTHADREKQKNSYIGERLGVAILPFETKGIGRELGEIDLLDKLTTAFVNLNRFKVVERAQLEQVLKEQKLGISGIIDISSAVEIGNAIGVEAVVCGSIVRSGQSASIDARLVDTETAAIICAKDAYATSISLPALSAMIQRVAEKIKEDMPLITGYVISVEGESLTLDLGHAKGVRKGVRGHVYREGEKIIHPVTKEVIGKKINELCDIRITQVFEGYSMAVVTKSKGGIPKPGDQVVTK